MIRISKLEMTGKNKDLNKIIIIVLTITTVVSSNKRRRRNDHVFADDRRSCNICDRHELPKMTVIHLLSLGRLY